MSGAAILDVVVDGGVEAAQPVFKVEEHVVPEAAGAGIGERGDAAAGETGGTFAGGAKVLVAGLVAAGLDGVERGLVPGEAAGEVAQVMVDGGDAAVVVQGTDAAGIIQQQTAVFAVGGEAAPVFAIAAEGNELVGVADAAQVDVAVGDVVQQAVGVVEDIGDGHVPGRGFVQGEVPGGENGTGFGAEEGHGSAQVHSVFVQFAPCAAVAVLGLVVVAQAEVAAAIVAVPAVFVVAEVVGAPARQDAFSTGEFGGGAVFAAHVGVVHLQFLAFVVAVGAVVHPEFVVTVVEWRGAFEEGSGAVCAGGKEQGGGQGQGFVHAGFLLAGY
ncbi:hypothetical protein HMPREF9080_02508 [Cardiobacterium valvarum F0432]|uniref:Uncharacterized protein n=1 Tax=Cardiobacterium valvarum F0432 TaxID=797473 RepID=G9ZI97_9GAMM|nr:hypothetical protein HMPREF9080_02508 [Cardiobacterium valvarum F0432]